MLMKLGPHRFQARGPSYQSFERAMQARFEAVDLIGTAPAYQYLGPGEETATLDGVIYPLAQDPGLTRRLAQLELEIGSGKPLVLVSGYGRVFGAFGVRGLTQTETMAFTRGEPQKVEFTLELVKINRPSTAIPRLF